MKNAIVLPNRSKDPELITTGLVVERLSKLGITPYISEDLPVLGAKKYKEIPNDAEVIIVIGGDGSVIDASILALKLDLPLLGVNVGKVGYLTTLEPDNLEELSRLCSGDYHITEKMLLNTVITRKNGGTISAERLALNDVVVSHSEVMGIADIKIENSRGDSVVYRADGVILSTPSGSTAYSLSAGGPVISHTLSSITVTPVCPHSFFNRAIVYSPEETIKITNHSNGPLNVSIDGRGFGELAVGDSCRVFKSERCVKILTFDQGNLFNTLSKKIKLLQDFV